MGASAEFHQTNPKSPDIRGIGVRLAGELLRGHVLGRPDECAALSKGVLQRAGHAEVRQLDTCASPGTQTQHATLAVCMSWCPDFEFRGT